MMKDRICELTGLTIEQLTSSNHLHSNAQENHQRSYQTSHQDDHFDNYQDTYNAAGNTDAYNHSHYSRAGSKNQNKTYNNQTQQQRSLTRNNRTNKRTASISLVNRIISLLLHNPALLADIEPIDNLELIEEGNVDILAALYPVSYTHLTLPTIYSV